MSFITEAVIGFIQDILTDVNSHLSYIIADINTYAIEINQTSAVTGLTIFTMLLGASLSVVIMGKQIIGVYGFGTKGDPDQDAMELIFRLCLALGAMGCNSWLFTELTRFANAVAKDITNSMGGDISGSNIQMTTNNIIMGSGSSSVMVFFSGFLMVGIIIFAINAFLRSAEITLSKILLPIFALDLLNSNPEKWNMFIFQYVVGFGSYLVQMLCFQIFAYQLSRLDTADIKSLMVLIAWLVMCIKTPHWLEKYIYATGTGQAISRGAGRLGQVLMYIGTRR